MEAKDLLNIDKIEEIEKGLPKPVKQKVSYYLDWDKIKQDCCPSCGWKMEEEPLNFVCKRHEEPFKIGRTKYQELKRRLQDEEQFSWKQPE